MIRSNSGVLRAPTASVIGGILLGWFAISSERCHADSPVIWKVEEDWELVINEPEDNTNSPQVTFFVTPSSLFGSTYFQLQMNYHADEDYSAGGFHVAAVRGDEIVDETRSQNQSLLTTDGDVIRWTSVAAVVNNKLLFAVKDGHCESWGDFGGPEYLVEMPALATQTFANYSHTQSSAATDIGFGGNRVSSVKLKRVRMFDSVGGVATITIPDPPQS
tara:strand:- start:40074 stop:40727 length:654 start_codon:yes stop_codon:yes gene_type:complete